MIAVINYGLGNLHSVQKALTYVGGSAQVTSDPEIILQAEKVVLPGVGAFADGMKGLNAHGLAEAVRKVAELGKPLLGICLGMQLFFEESDEQGIHRGLALLPGKVIQFKDPGIKVPQIGWNQVDLIQPSPLTKGLLGGEYLYFNHSYYCVPSNSENILTMTDYGHQFASAVRNKQIYGVQFHPEKSQRIGLQILRNFVELSNE